MSTSSTGESGVRPSVRPTLSPADRFQLVVEAIEDYAIYMLDPDGLIESWSPGAERLKGYRADEVLGKPYSIFFRPEDVAEGLPKWQLSRARLHGKTEEQGWRVRKDGSVFWANIIVSRILDDDGTLLGYAKITRDVTEQLRLRELERSLKRMDQFIAMIGHELRNPLGPIRYASTFIQEHGNFDTKQTVAWGILDRQLSLLTRLLDGLLDVGRVTSGKLRISPARISVKQVVEQAVETFSSNIEHRELQVFLPEQEIWVNADELRITQVLQNLLSNALKFTLPGGRIEVRAHVCGTRLHIQVKDDGLGMDPATVDDLFRLFAQGQAQRETHQPGLGIGLALSRMIVEMHGGTITGTSSGRGLGSVFRFELPGAELKSI
ncbi:MAG: PAS domain-containing sensor histidine kinase [Hydrogenophaga sp.]|uniref:PAS domain-containing sensor histidine kinase n=1 Tax=Hydrogenophaga sp. TaxID=1904254 RepID=UPI0026344FA2|nr:PAS domain-containing sensor histidine kinase [Hydrogenophaga sp.]MCV0438899.1 PAS domain-containing sensor histidine kinase [Hydrogenophaga sp.]